MFAYGFACCHLVWAPVSRAMSHGGPGAWEVLGKSSFWLQLGCFWSNFSVFGCKSLTTANGGDGRGIPSKNIIPFPPLPLSQFGKMIWGWGQEAFVLVCGKHTGLWVYSTNSSVNVPSAACPISVLTPQGNKWSMSQGKQRYECPCVKV